MNKIFNGKNIAAAIITLAIGTVVALGASKLVFGGATTVTGNVVSFILNPEGKVDGAILDSGDQVTFGGQTGELVAANVQVGGQLTATGDAGSKSDFGRELHAKTLQIGDQTITVIGGKPRPPKDGGPKDKGPKGDKPRPPKDGPRPDDANAPKPDPKDAPPAPPVNDANAPQANNGEMPPPPAPPVKETAKTASSVKFVLVGHKGEARGLILADGTQINLPPEVKDSGITFSTSTNVAVEGEVSKSSFGTFIKPNVLTIDNQTFSFNR